MSRTPKYHKDEALEAALLAGPQGLPSSNPTSPETMAWSVLSHDLHEALRPGPGGLHDHQRQQILDAAMALTDQAKAAPRPVVEFPPHRREPVLWTPIAAAACFALLLIAGARWFPIFHGWQGTSENIVAVERPLNPLRLLPSGLAASMFPAATRTPTPPSLATALEDGFQPSSWGNVTELVPNPAWKGFERVRSTFRHEGCLPVAGTVAIEEMLNYFPYGLPDPAPGQPISLAAENGPCPWEPTHRLVRVSLRAWGEARQIGVAARDVRIVLDFNPLKISAFRLIGYQGGTTPLRVTEPHGTDLMPGQGATALYEVIPLAAAGSWRGDGWEETGSGSTSPSTRLLAARVFYRMPGHSDQIETKVVLSDSDPWMEEVSSDFRFTAAVAGFGLILNHSIEGYRFVDVLDLASTSLEHDPDGRRAEFVGLVKQAVRMTSD